MNFIKQDGQPRISGGTERARGNVLGRSPTTNRARGGHSAMSFGIAVLILGAVLSGCGGRPERPETVYPLTGELHFEGKPAAGASIILHTQDDSISARPMATVGDDGTFAVTTYEPGDGAPPGEYKVTVEWHRPVDGQISTGDDLPPPNVLPPAYASPKTTPITVTVEEGENTFPTITFQN